MTKALAVRGASLGVVTAVLVLGSTRLVAQHAAGDPQGVTALPQGQLFGALIADPKTPRFDTSVLQVSSGDRSTTVWAAAFGESFGLVRWGTAQRGVQLDLSGGVFAQFDLGTPSADLVNADYVIGLPLTFRAGGLSAQLRLYHQSSHLGDEFLINTRTQRVNLTFESVEWLTSYERHGWRVYGGGEYLVHREPRDLRARVVQIGVERRQEAVLFRIARLGVARLVGALDGQWAEQHAWGPAWSAKAGLELGPAAGDQERTRRWSVLMQVPQRPLSLRPVLQPRGDVRRSRAAVQLLNGRRSAA